MSVVEKQARLLEECIDSVKQWNDLINQYANENEKVGYLNSVRDITKKYCLMKFEAEKQDEAMKRIENHIEESGENAPTNLEAMLKTLLADNTSELDFPDSEVWQSVFGAEDVEEIIQERERFSANVYETLDDSLACTEVFKLPVDPLTKKNITEPFKNKVCGHVYEYKSILVYIKTMKRKAKCPYMGCGNRELRTDDLVRDDNLSMIITQFSQNSTVPNGEA